MGGDRFDVVSRCDSVWWVCLWLNRSIHTDANWLLRLNLQFPWWYSPCLLLVLLFILPFSPITSLFFFYLLLFPMFSLPHFSFFFPALTPYLTLSFSSFLSQPITLSFLPGRRYYQRSASGKLHPESFLELEIGVVRRCPCSHGWGRLWGGLLLYTSAGACFIQLFLPLPLLLHPLPPIAVAPVLSPLQHTPTANRKLLEGCAEQNDRLSRTGPPDAEGCL